MTQPAPTTASRICLADARTRREQRDVDALEATPGVISSTTSSPPAKATFLPAERERRQRDDPLGGEGALLEREQHLAADGAGDAGDGDDRSGGHRLVPGHLAAHLPPPATTSAVTSSLDEAERLVQRAHRVGRPASAAITQLMRIGEVEIMSRLTPASASVREHLAPRPRDASSCPRPRARPWRSTRRPSSRARRARRRRRRPRAARATRSSLGTVNEMSVVPVLGDVLDDHVDVDVVLGHAREDLAPPRRGGRARRAG